MADPNQLESLDEHLYEDFKKIGSFAVSKYISPDAQSTETQKKAFLEGQIDHPTFHYPELDPEDLNSREEALLEFKKHLPTEEDQLLKKVYLWKVNEKIAEIRMIRCALTGEARRFQKYSEYLYGKPSPEAFHGHLDQLRQQITEAKKSDKPQLIAAAEALEAILPESPAHLERPQLPAAELIAKVQEQTRREVSRFIHLPEKKEKYAAADIIEIFKKAIAELKNQDWQIIEEPTAKSSLSVDYETMTVRVPPTMEKNLQGVVKGIVHEIGTHALRFENGERSRLKLLGLGLDRYSVGEEGVAKVRENAYYGEMESYYPSDSHLAISLAYGLDGKKRNFREVFEFLKVYQYFLAWEKDQKNTMTVEQAGARAEDKAWSRCVRTFKGSAGQTPGVCFTHDVIYSKGSIAVWDVLGKNPEELRRISVGKYDPANVRHLWVLERIGISDQDLEELQKYK